MDALESAIAHMRKESETGGITELDADEARAVLDALADATRRAEAAEAIVASARSFIRGDGHDKPFITDADALIAALWPNENQLAARGGKDDHGC